MAQHWRQLSPGVPASPGAPTQFVPPLLDPLPLPDPLLLPEVLPELLPLPLLEPLLVEPLLPLPLLEPLLVLPPELLLLDDPPSACEMPLLVPASPKLVLAVLEQPLAYMARGTATPPKIEMMRIRFTASSRGYAASAGTRRHKMRCSTSRCAG